MGELSLGFPTAALLPQLPSQDVWAFLAVFLPSLQPVGLANSVQPWNERCVHGVQNMTRLGEEGWQMLGMPMQRNNMFRLTR